MAQTDVTERTAIVTYTLLRELQRLVAGPPASDDVTLGIILGTAMFCDDQIGPFRAQRLLQQAPGIVLKTDAHVSEAQITGVLPVLQALGDHLGHLANYLAAAAPASSGASALQPL